MTPRCITRAIEDIKAHRLARRIATVLKQKPASCKRSRGLTGDWALHCGFLIAAMFGVVYCLDRSHVYIALIGFGLYSCYLQFGQVLHPTLRRLYSKSGDFGNEDDDPKAKSPKSAKQSKPSSPPARHTVSNKDASDKQGTKSIGRRTERRGKNLDLPLPKEVKETKCHSPTEAARDEILNGQPPQPVEDSLATRADLRERAQEEPAHHSGCKAAREETLKHCAERTPRFSQAEHCAAQEELALHSPQPEIGLQQHSMPTPIDQTVLVKEMETDVVPDASITPEPQEATPRQQLKEPVSPSRGEVNLRHRKVKGKKPSGLAPAPPPSPPESLAQASPVADNVLDMATDVPSDSAPDSMPDSNPLDTLIGAPAESAVESVPLNSYTPRELQRKHVLEEVQHVLEEMQSSWALPLEATPWLESLEISTEIGSAPGDKSSPSAENAALDGAVLAPPPGLTFEDQHLHQDQHLCDVEIVADVVSGPPPGLSLPGDDDTQAEVAEPSGEALTWQDGFLQAWAASVASMPEHSRPDPGFAHSQFAAPWLGASPEAMWQWASMGYSPGWPAEQAWYDYMATYPGACSFGENYGAWNAEELHAGIDVNSEPLASAQNPFVD